MTRSSLLALSIFTAATLSAQSYVPEPAYRQSVNQLRYADQRAFYMRGQVNAERAYERCMERARNPYDCDHYRNVVDHYGRLIASMEQPRSYSSQQPMPTQRPQQPYGGYQQPAAPQYGGHQQPTYSYQQPPTPPFVSTPSAPWGSDQYGQPLLPPGSYLPARRVARPASRPPARFDENELRMSWPPPAVRNLARPAPRR